MNKLRDIENAFPMTALEIWKRLFPGALEGIPYAARTGNGGLDRMGNLWQIHKNVMMYRGFLRTAFSEF